MSDKPTVFNYRDYVDVVTEKEKLRNKVANMEIRDRIRETTIEKVREEICDDYCRWPFVLMREPDKLLSICERCPLDRL